MNEIKKLYVLEWLGPYNSVNAILDNESTEDGSIYLITGRERYERGSEHIKYVGITERDPAKRLSDPDHLEKQERILYKKYWVGRFSRGSDRNSRSHAELIETLFVHFLTLQGIRLLNDKKTRKVPDIPLAVINRWGLKSHDSHRVNKPSILSDMPDVLLFDGDEYWGSEKLKLLDEE